MTALHTTNPARASGLVYVNVSLSGLSTSIGRPGATLNVSGVRGPRATVGEPGSGLSYSEQLGPNGGARAGPCAGAAHGHPAGLYAHRELSSRITEPAYLPLFLTDAEIAEICAPLKVQGYLIKYPQCLRRNGRTGRIALSD